MKSTTKRALLMSALALVLSFSMLLGTTFAWFTDTASSNGNKIIAGTLDVDLLMHDGTDYVDISETSAPIFGKDGSLTANENNADTLWEPGKTQVAFLAIQNNGNLALKYTVSLVVRNVAKDLYKVMEYEIVPDAEYGDTVAWDDAAAKSPAVGEQTVSDGEGHLAKDGIHYFALLIHMDELAGNNYMEGEVDFDLIVYATQDTVEKDFFDEYYDKDALFAVADGVYVDENTGDYVASSVSSLSNVSELATKDPSITSVKLMTENGTVDVPVVNDAAALDEAIDEDNSHVVLTSGSYTVDTAKNTTVTIVGNGEDTKLSIESEGEHNTDYGFDGSTVTFENVEFNVGGYLNGYARMNATYNNCIINGTYTLNGASVFNNCTFNKSGDDYCVWTWGAPTAEFNNCTFNTSGKAILLYGGANTVLKVNNCVFNDANNYAEVNNKAAIEVGSDWTTDTKTIIATGCVVNGFDITNKGTNTGSTLWGNKNSLSADRLSVTINGTKVYGN